MFVTAQYLEHNELMFVTAQYLEHNRAGTEPMIYNQI